MISFQRGIILAALGKNPTEQTTYEKRFDKNSDLIQSSLQGVGQLEDDDEGRRLTAGITAELAAWRPRYEELITSARAGNIEEANRIRKEITAPLHKSIDAQARQVASIEMSGLEKRKKALSAQYVQIRWICNSLMVLFAIVGVLVIGVVHQINGELRRAISELFQGVDQVGNAASQISNSSQQLAQGSSEQAASLEETSASATEISAMARQNSEKSDSAASLVAASLAKFAQADQALQNMQTAMIEINNSSDSISKIIKVIDEIAFQTNILALNAAVEAARAGESGLGFAVVANEVRTLAQRCAQAAKDTEALIGESIGRSHAGKTHVHEVADAIRLVSEGSSKIKLLVDEVNAGSREQARGIEQVTRAIAQMEQVTQSSAANAEESASAAVELTSQSQSLKQTVGHLAALVGSETTV